MSGPDGSKVHLVKFNIKVACVLSLENAQLHNAGGDYWPTFRGKFLNNRFETLPVGKKSSDTADGTGDGWEEVAVNKAPKEDAAAGGKKPVGKGGKDKAAATVEEPVLKPVDKKLFVYNTEFEETKADESLAWRLNNDPFLHCIMGLFPELRVPPEEVPSGGKAPAKKPAEKNATTTQTTGLATLPFAAWIPLDISPLLADKPAVSITLGDINCAVAAVQPDVVSTVSAMSTAQIEQSHSTLAAALGNIPASAGIAPGGLHFLYVSIGIASCREESDDIAQTVTAAAKSKTPASKSALPTVETHTLIVPPRLLSTRLRQVLRPVSIRLRSADNVPGITVAEGSDASLRRLIEPDEHRLLRETCRPVVALLRLGELFTAGAKKSAHLLTTVDGKVSYLPETLCKLDGDRFLLTPGKVHQSFINFDAETVVCLGQLDGCDLREILSTQTLEIEIHDRILPNWEVLQEYGVTKRVEEKTLGSISPSTTSQVATDTMPAEGASRSPVPSVSKPQSAKQRPTSASKKAVSSPSVPEAAAPKLPAMNELSTEACQTAVAIQYWGFYVPPPQRVKFFEGLWTGSMECPYAAFHAHSAAEAAAPTASRPGSPSKPKASAAAAGKSKTDAKVASVADSAPDVFRHSHHEVDDLFIKELLTRASSFRERYPHGIAHIKLDTLMLPQPMSQSLSSNLWQVHGRVLPSNRGYIPATPEPLWALDKQQKICLAPGAYNIKDTRLKLAVSTALDVDLRGCHKKHPYFERLVIKFPYADDQTLQTIMGFIGSTNSKEFPHAPSFRSYVIDESERKQLDDGDREAICGCQIIDADSRLFILEGLHGGALGDLAAALPRAQLNTPKRFLLYNPAVKFPSRLYSSLSIAPRFIRLRVPLAAILASPAVYASGAHTKELLDAVQCFRRLVDARSIEDAKSYNFFPSVPGLAVLEEKFGDTVSLVDIFGVGSPEAQALQTTRAKLSDLERVTSSHLGGTLDASKLLSPHVSRTVALAGHYTSTDLPPEVAPTHSSAARDFIQENIEYVSELSATRTRESVVEYFASTSTDGVPVYPYGGQKLNNTGLQMDELRKALGHTKSAVFTRSLQFASQAIDIIEPSEIQKFEAQKSKEKRMTAKGFVYPARRSPDELRKVEHRPTESRIIDLQQAWVDATEMRARQIAKEKAELAALGRPMYNTHVEPHPLSDGAFGYTDAQNHRVPASEFFKSVHLPPGGIEDEMKAEKLKQKQEWESKLVVETTTFRPFHSPDASKFERFKPMLRDEPKKKTFKAVATGDFPGATKRRPLEAAPVSMYASDRWIDPRDEEFQEQKREARNYHFKTSMLPPDAKTSVYHPLRMAGLAVSSPPGTIPAIKSHKHGINTD